MGFFDRYPYTNWHNVNLDWVLERVKEWGQMVEANDQAFQDLEEANASFKEYVTNYLQELDIQAQIDDKLDRMFESGELTDYLQPYIAGNVSQWLDKNITQPTGVVIDSSLTVAGAAADAKSAGDKINNAKTSLEYDIFYNIPAVEEKTIYESFTDILPDKYSLTIVSNPAVLNFTYLDTQDYKTYYLYVQRTCYFWFKNIPQAPTYLGFGKIDNAGQVTHNSANPPVYSVSGANGVRLRNIDGNLPTENNKITLLAGTFISFTCFPETATNTVIVFESNSIGIDKTRLNKNIILDTSQLETIKGGYVEYKNENNYDNSTEHFKIYLKNNSGYTCYIFAHSVVAAKKCDIWRIAYIKGCDNTFNITDDITDIGEFECAIMLDGRSDFSGGYLHGNETVQSFNLFLDGILTNKTSLTERQHFNTLQFVQTSQLFDKSNNSVAIANHTSMHSFGNGNLKVEQTIKFLNSYQVNKAYLSMFPIDKSYSTHYFTNSDFTYKAVTLPVNESNRTDTLYLFGNGYESIFKNVKLTGVENDAGGLLVTDNNGGIYNKSYYITATNAEVSSSTFWQSITEYEII